MSSRPRGGARPGLYPSLVASLRLTCARFHREMGQYEYTVLPFGIKNSPAEMQRAVDEVFRDLIATGCVFVYIDDIGIGTDTLEQHYELLNEIFRRCTRHGLFVQILKCHFLFPSLVYLGFRVSEQGIQPDEKRVGALLKLKSPTSRKELQTTLGLLGYLRRFVPHFGGRLQQLSRMVSPSVAFTWTEECEIALRAVIQDLADEVLLATPQPGGNYVMLTDASDIGLGAVLLQRQKDEFLILEFASRKLIDAEKKWSVRDREATAIKFACQKFHHYISGYKTLVVTDCQSLKFLKESDRGRVQRLWFYLQRYDLQIVHWAGEFNVLADWLSRQWT